MTIAGENGDAGRGNSIGDVGNGMGAGTDVMHETIPERVVDVPRISEGGLVRDHP